MNWCTAILPRFNRQGRSILLLTASLTAVLFARYVYAAPAWVGTATTSGRSTKDLQVERPFIDGKTVKVTIVLRLRNGEELAASLRRPRPTGVSNVDVDNYLPTAEQVGNVERYLVRSGFKNVRPSANRLLVTAEGGPGQIKTAFNTTLVHANRNGVSGLMNVSDAQVPSEFAGTILSVLGLQTIDRGRPLAMFGGSPESSKAASGINPLAFQTAYSATTLPTASKTPIGIIAEGNLSPSIADLHAYESQNGLQTINPSVVLAGSASSDLSGQIEWDIDSQTAQATAGGQLAGITFYVATSLTNADLTSAFNAAVSANATKVVNVSIGECELSAKADGSAAADDQIFALALLRRQTFSVATGDSGSAQCSGSTGVSTPRVRSM